jgi:23S rRNA pseudouridine1911/1915/1917 synthase
MKYRLKNTATLFETIMVIYKGISKQKAKQMIRYSEFRVNGEKIGRHPKQILETGSELEIIPIEKNRTIDQSPTGRNPVVIHFEDAYLIVARKPAGILSCGNKELVINNSYHKLLETFLLERDGKKTRLWVIHRLDREVEGLLMFAKSEKLQKQIKDEWQKVTKKYIALTENRPAPSTGIIENWLMDTSARKVIACPKETPGSKYAKTEYAFIRNENPYHLVEITLHTGRKNQIRVHLAGIRCPVVGDRKYGADSTFVRQIRLAAFFLEFQHPVTKKWVSVEYSPSQRFFKPSTASDEKYKITG